MWNIFFCYIGHGENTVHIKITCDSPKTLENFIYNNSIFIDFYVTLNCQI